MRAAVIVVLGGLCAVAGCGGQTKVSASALRSRLAPESVAPGFNLERTLDWSDPVNLVGEGIRLPEATHPSQGVSEIRGAGFEGAAGEQLNRGGPNGQTITTGVIKFASAANAAKVRDWMHGEDLQEPCFSQCIFTPLNLPVAGIPGATAVRQVPNARSGPPPGGPPPGARLPGGRRVVIGVPPGAPPGASTGPPTNFLIEFAIGRYLYFAATQGGTPAQFSAGARQYYDDVRKLPAS